MNAHRHPFADLPFTPAAHFSLYFYAAIGRLIDQTARAFGSRESALAQFPFLAGYWSELAVRGLDRLADEEAIAWWCHALNSWEASTPRHLPLRALREAAGLEYDAMVLLMTIGICEEDARFGALFERLQGLAGQHHPTMGLLTTWWRSADDPGETRASLHRLHALGLIHVGNADAPRSEWVLQPSTAIWDALRSEQPTTLDSWMRYRAATELPDPDELIVPESVRRAVMAAPTLLTAGEAQALIVRGPLHNGRRTMLGAVSRALGRGMLEIEDVPKLDDDRRRLIGPLATALHALPVFVLDLAPGETVDLPSPAGYIGPLGVVLGRQGGVGGPGVERSITVTLPLPDPEARRLHWRRSWTAHGGQAVDDLGVGFRMTSGNIRRAAGLACSYAALDGRATVRPDDVRQASRALNRQALDTLATYVVATGDWSHLATSAETLHELSLLESRCRHRERLPDAVGEAAGGSLTTGVRALFTGPSGTGKTLSARLLASALHMDLYRLDLSSVVNKYIGETEKNLDRAFARAEELDVVLLLDEGDALLTQRTGVKSSTDRYANLETNYLLQRLESFEGILIVTTNANQRIDSAFQRRMDVVVEFHAPDIPERWAIWQLHLPAQHTVPSALVDEVALRCALNGGQIRNTALHAALLALDDGGLVTAAHLEAAVQREYRKMGAVCPMRWAGLALGAGG